MDLTTVAKMSAYLTSRSIAFEDLRLLSGGSCNFVFHLTRTNPQASRDACHSVTTNDALILKHAQPYIAQNPNYAFPTSRMDLEHSVLVTLPKLLPSNPLVAPVGVEDYDPENHVMTVHDGGSVTLKTAYSTLDAETVQGIGSEVAIWLSQLHTSTSMPSSSNPPDWWRIWDNDHLSKSIYRFSYNALAPTLSQYGYGEEGRRLGERINEIYGSALQTDNEAICHGDFWPGNILLYPHYPHAFKMAQLTRLTIVDFEMSRRGNQATDVAQFAAEAWLLDTFRGAKGLLNAFLERYGKLNRIDVERVAVHMGAHLICWPARLGGEWGDEEAVKECVRVGRELLLSALGEGEDDLESGPGGALRALLP